MRVRVIGVALLAASSVSGGVCAGNLDSYYMSGEAALQGGAITADARDGGAMWYNPAGLGDIAGLRLDVGANAFRLSLGGVPDLDATGEDQEITRLRTINFISIPASMTLTHRFGDVGVGFGLFVPVTDSSTIRTQLKERSASGDHAIELGLDAHSTLTDYFVGPSFGWKVSPEVSVGASLFANYRTDLGVSMVEGNVIDRDGEVEAAFVDHETDDWQQIGAQAVFGVKLHPGRHWAAGITLRTPVLRLYQVRQKVARSSDPSTARGPCRPIGSRTPRASRRSSSPLRGSIWGSAGSSRSGTARWRRTTSFRSRTTRTRSSSTPWRTCAPGYAISGRAPSGWVEGSTPDRSPTEAKSFTENGLNYYGITVAGELATPYETIKKGDETFVRPRGLVFATGARPELRRRLRTHRTGGRGHVGEGGNRHRGGAHARGGPRVHSARHLVARRVTQKRAP